VRKSPLDEIRQKIAMAHAEQISNGLRKAMGPVKVLEKENEELKAELARVSGAAGKVSEAELEKNIAELEKPIEEQKKIVEAERKKKAG
jgi:hypothetical protein